MAGFGRPPVVPPGRGMASREVYGLLPGRGPAGRGAGTSLDTNGLLPPGRGPSGRGAASSASTGAGAGTAAAAAAAAAAARTSGGTSSGISTGAGAGAAFLVVFFAGAAAAWAGNSSRRRRTTGGSIVEDAERTNSPMSWSLATRTLLSTPSSLASSYTRTLATALLLAGPGVCRPDRYRWGVLIAARSSRARRHRFLPSLELGVHHFGSRLGRCRLTVSPGAPAPGWCPAVPTGARPSGTLDAARRGRDTPVRGAAMRPGPASVLGRRGRPSRWKVPRRPRPATGRSWSPVPGTPHTCAWDATLRDLTGTSDRTREV